jgi:hypothetical protein
VPFQFTTAPDAKLLPLTVKVKPALPDLALFGESSMMTGTTPGCVVAVLDEPYPHPVASIASNKTEIIFINFSSWVFPSGMISPTARRGVRPLLFSCKGNVCREGVDQNERRIISADSLAEVDKPADRIRISLKLVQSIQGGDFVGFGQSGIVEDRIAKIFDAGAHRQNGLAYVNDFRRPVANRVHSQQFE